MERPTATSSTAGSGNDSITSGFTNAGSANNGNGDSLVGGTGNDTITGGTAQDTVEGGADDDLINAGMGNDTITGGDGWDAISGGDHSDTIHAGSGADMIRGDGEMLDIPNAGFEANTYGDGGFSSTVDGWTVTGNGGSWNTTAYHYGEEAPQGANVGFLNAGARMETTLARTYDSTESYQLDLQIGTRSDSSPADYTINIYAGTTLIGSATGTAPAPGTFEPVTVTTSVADANLDGDALRIELVHDGGGQLNFDALTLAATPASGGGADTINAGGGDDIAYGEAGDDVMVGGAGSDLLSGGAGADTIIGGAVVQREDFSEGVEGWTSLSDGSAVTSNEAMNDGNAFMGRFAGNGTGSEQIQKTFALQDGAEHAVIEFDLLKFDSWSDGEKFTIYVDGVAAFDYSPDGAGSGAGYGADASGSFAGGTWSVTSGGSDSELGFWAESAVTDDRVYTARLVLNAPGSAVTLGFGSSLDESLSNESWGIDTVQIASTDDPDYQFSEEGDNDTISGGAGSDVIMGGVGDDVLTGGDGDDLIEGGTGDDVLKTGLGQDTLVGGAGDDTLMNAAGDDSLVGGAGDDLIVATAGNDTLEGGAGHDTLMGGTDRDSLDGGAGDDLLLGDLAGIAFNETGTDGVGLAANLTDFPATQLSYEVTFSSETVLDGSTWPPLASYDTGTYGNEFSIAIESGGDFRIGINHSFVNTGISASAFFDGSVQTIAVTWDSATGALEFYANGTNVFSTVHATGQTIESGGTFALGQEQDSPGGGFSTAQIFEGTIYGARLYDDIRSAAEIEASALGPVADTSDSALVANWVADPATGGFTDWTGSHAMTVSGDTSLTWSEGADTLIGGTGADTMYGGGDGDTFVVEDGFGADVIEGGEGGTDYDRLDLSGLTASVTVTYDGSEFGTATDGTDTLTFSEVEALTMTDAADSVDARETSSGVTIDGEDGADTILGGSGHDTIAGGDGSDYIQGGAGNDLLTTGLGNDTLIGGAGDDHADELRRQRQPRGRDRQ